MAGKVGRRSWLEQAGPLLLILGSVFTAPLFTVGGLALTGDRLLGLAALGVATGLGVAGRLHWTPIHSALAVFVGAQVLTTVLNAAGWPQGLKFVIVYVLAFACFCLAAEWTRGSEGRDRHMAWWWITVGAALGVVGTVMAMWANLTQWLVWGTGIAQGLYYDPAHPRFVFAGKVTFKEWNLLSSFLLIPFVLGLWFWHPPADARWSPWRLTAALGALVFGLVFGLTRAAWVSMAGIITFWWWVRRPRRRQVVALGSMLALAFLLQAAVLGGNSPLWFRVVEPVKTRSDVNMQSRLVISRATIPSWVDRPLGGHGAGSSNQLPALFPGGIDKIWNSNIVLFVLHDSGLLGLAALLSLGVVVWRRCARAIRREAHGTTSSLAVPLLVVGGALCFTYQFAHGLWLMYPYVYLGLLTAATEPSAGNAPTLSGLPRS